MIAQASVKELPLTSESIDLIFTDPPYLGEFLHTYDWLAKEANRVLKPGGFLLAMAGGYYLNKIFAMFDEQLAYHWKIELWMEHGNIVWPRKIITRSKSILAYSKGKSNPKENTLGAMHGGGMDKRWHRWGQDVESACYYITKFSNENDLVLDPFVGGGTTAVACEVTNRRHVSFDIDFKACDTTRQRLAGAQIPKAAPLFEYGISKPLEK